VKVPYDVVLPQVNVLGSTMAYREAGNPDGPVALFLHGNPTSSYIWRNIIPLVAPVAHCIAPDLIGFGQSGKPDIECRFADHVRYLDAFLANAGISSAFVIAQDWGTALAFHLAARRPEFVRGLAFMEFLRPLPTWADFPAIARETFQKFRTPGVGEKMILEGNAFVEGVIPLGTVRKLTERKCLITERHSLLLSRGDPLGVSRMNCRSLENRRMCIQLWRKHIVLWRSRLTRSSFSREIQAV
jgi:haloalkane dehalogenase